MGGVYWGGWGGGAGGVAPSWLGRGSSWVGVWCAPDEGGGAGGGWFM